MDDDIASRWGPRVVDYAAGRRRRRPAGDSCPPDDALAADATVDPTGAVAAPVAGAAPRRDVGVAAVAWPSCVLVVVAVLLGAMIGPAGPTWWRVPLELLDHLPLDRDRQRRQPTPSGTSIWHVRMPRVVLGGLVGAMLSLAGASYQGVFRNPLVDPYLLGAAAGAGLGATLVFTVRSRRDRRLAGRPGAGRWRSCSPIVDGAA